ncbi:hypothetical protein ACEQ38_08020 [Ralstonia syzygii subsp. celebesensis]|uniref:Uncharacterized protein n=1 Tax=blood disease bacterium R229 TaxID=741978 RepID=G2ZJ77_9RALS|nr:hypothetical protein [Ralstonia syzygii]QQV54610.1 hypothetical protein JK151_10525 [Ralstonia syzygii subsp. celebesensis]CCA79090.1 hypothetical protein BDB_40043 [blood disease bacterium R229]
MTSMQPKYGSATDVAKRIREWLGPHGRENTASLLLHEALQALEAQSTIGVGDGSGNLFVRGDHDAIKCVQGYIFDAEKWRAAQPGADARAARALCAAAAKRSDKTDGELWGEYQDEFIADAKAALLAAQSGQRATPEPMVRFCPQCGLIGEPGERYRDCCPDGSHARVVPKKFAEDCRQLFRLVVDGVKAESPTTESGQQTAVATDAPTRGADIPATMRHDAGAYARCDYCGRYSDNPKSLARNEWPCDCGKLHGWCGSFKKPTAESQWSDATPMQQEAKS